MTNKISSKALLAIPAAAALAAAFTPRMMFHFAINPTGRLTMQEMIKTKEFTKEHKEFMKWTREEAKVRMRKSFDALTLKAYYYAQKKPDGSIDTDCHRYAVCVHGYGDHKLESISTAATHFYKEGFNVMVPCLRGHGMSGGNYIGMGWYDRLDVKLWIETLAAEDPEAEIVVYGISMGGATVMCLSGDYLPAAVKCIIEDCGFSSAWDEFAYCVRTMMHIPTFPYLYLTSQICKLRCGFSFKEASAVKQLKNARLPMLFLHGEEDTFVPFEMLQKNFDACGSEHKEMMSIPGAPHASSAQTDPEKYWGKVSEFINKYL